MHQWLETGLRDALFADARRLVQALLNDRSLVEDDESPRPLENVHRNRLRHVQTLFGSIELRRRYYHHTAARTGRCPLDEALDLVRGCTPALARLICRASAQCGSYDEGARDLAVYTGLQLESRHFGRLVAEAAPTLRQALDTLPVEDRPPVVVLYAECDGTGVPMRREELEGCQGKQPDGSARTREAKLGSVFTQTIIPPGGEEPIRDPDSTSYVATFQGCRDIGTLLRKEALRRGLAQAQLTVCLGDGAPWIWENARLNFPNAIEILDFYHACEHLGELAAALWGQGSEEAKTQQDSWCHLMKQTSSAPIIEQARILKGKRQRLLNETQRKIIRREIQYFQTNAARTRYGHFRARGLFIGSGVIEAGCKTVVGRRLKASGMFWSQHGAEDLLSIRCLLLGPHFEAAWKGRLPILAKQRAKARRWSHQENKKVA